VKKIALIYFLIAPVISQAQSSGVSPLGGFSGITGKVYDEGTGLPLPSRIEIYDDVGKLQETYYKYVPEFSRMKTARFNTSRIGKIHFESISWHRLPLTTNLFEITTQRAQRQPFI